MDLKSFFAFGVQGPQTPNQLLPGHQELAGSKSPEAGEIPAHIYQHILIFTGYL